MKQQAKNNFIRYLSYITMILFLGQGLAFDIGDIPLQDEGRIKPLDTFARNHLLAFYGKRSIKIHNLTATDWLLDLILDPQNGKDKKIFNIRNPNVVSSLFLDWSKEHKYSFNEIIPGLSNQVELIRMIDSKPNTDRTSFEKQLLELSKNALRFEEISYLKGMKLIPPFKQNQTGEWLSPYDFIVSGLISEPHQQRVLDALQGYLASRLENQDELITIALSNYETVIKETSTKLIDISRLKYETWMNRTDLFTVSIMFYIMAFIFLCISWLIQHIWLNRLSDTLLIIGFAIHGLGILIRMFILNRPPVSTLYESVIFVSFIVLLFAIVIEYYRRDSLGIFVGSVSGIIFHFIGFGYASDGDTLEMLVAVLNSNFWLATHVTTITIGYGASLVAGFVGHIYLVQAFRNSDNKTKLKSIFNNLFGITLVALFFTLFGTILGGIWADQSWGRFWGWDPKENGALLIVLWQLMMIHMRLSGLAKPLEFALGMGLNNIIVAMAWFGVNLLQVGLHSYGFDDGVAMNLYIFILFELVFCLGFYYIPKLKVRYYLAKNDNIFNQIK